MALSIIGVMSGSSLDGLDMAYCTMDEEHDRIVWRIEAAQTNPFTPEWKSRLKLAPGLSGRGLMELDAAFGTFIGEQVHEWMRDNHFTPDIIASHGHTVFHEPSLHFTTQIGSGAHIAAITSVDTITSFRNADVARGGQGAPFAPVGDRDLFHGYDGFLNLGGIANISLRDTAGQWKAWDICPCNQALNFLAEKLRLPFDQNGAMAKTGKSKKNIVDALISMYPIPEGKPISLSNDVVQATWISFLEKTIDPVQDALASVTEAIASTILGHIKSWDKGNLKILVTGGGAHNSTLVNRLNETDNAAGIVFEKPDSLIIDFKESLLMAYLGYLSALGRSYGIHSITGASGDSIGGAYFKATR